jgi:hypothetical protein
MINIKNILKGGVIMIKSENIESSPVDKRQFGGVYRGGAGGKFAKRFSNRKNRSALKLLAKKAIKFSSSYLEDEAEGLYEVPYRLDWSGTV